MKKPRWKKLKHRLRPSTDVIRDRLLQIEGVTLSHAHKFIIRRWKNLREVRRYAFAWLLFVGLLICVGVWQTNDTQRLYSVSGPAEGTTYTEGVFGTVDNLNPLFAGTPAERAVTRLIFAGLLRYDERSQLVGDLAESWKVDETGKIYTVKLRPQLKWQDGSAITAKDVAYTFALIKDANTRSPLYASWRTIAVNAADPSTVVFTLPAPYAPFLNSLTTGVLPEHVLSTIPAAQLRNNQFNRSPIVGSGPFSFKELRTVNNDQSHMLIRLTANAHYYRGAPKLTNFNMHAFKDADKLVRAYKTQQVAALSDMPAQEVSNVVRRQLDTVVNAPLYNGVYAFFKTSNPVLQDAKVRQALAASVKREDIVRRLNNLVTPLHGPLLPGQLGYTKNFQQTGYNRALAEQLLDQAGWVKNAQGKRVKDGRPLQISLVSVSSGEYPDVVAVLLKEWDSLGVTIQTQLIKPDEFQQTVILPHAYDILVYELAIGQDPDVYAYWHSSQANERGLNLSEYKSAKVDDALDTARTRHDPALREAKYHTFTQQWLADTPAVALYQPNLIYLHNQNITTFTSQRLAEPADRYNNVIYWAAAKEVLRATR